MCKFKYEIKHEFNWKCNRDCRGLFCDNINYCGLREEEYLLNSIGGLIGYILVLIGITVWIFATCILFSFPSSGLPMYLYYIIAIFDIIVGCSTLWFVIKSRFLTSLFLAIFYLLRCLFLLFGWIPTINILNINMYNNNHVNIISYFAAISFISFILLFMCTTFDLIQQISKYKIKQQTLILNHGNIIIDINHINHTIHHHQNDQF